MDEKPFDDASVGGIALELLKEVKEQAVRWMRVSFLISILWFATIIAFILYMYQYDYVSTVEQTGVYTLSDSQGNVISTDISPEQLERILEIINGDNKSD